MFGKSHINMFVTYKTPCSLDCHWCSLFLHVIRILSYKKTTLHGHIKRAKKCISEFDWLIPSPGVDWPAFPGWWMAVGEWGWHAVHWPASLPHPVAVLRSLIQDKHWQCEAYGLHGEKKLSVLQQSVISTPLTSKGLSVPATKGGHFCSSSPCKSFVALVL